jgi:outer membrane protein assembly factor BamA
MRFISTLILCFILSSFLLGQGTVRKLEVESIRFNGNATLKSSLLVPLMQTRVSPWGPWKFIYAHLSESFGQKPEYFDPGTFRSDYYVLKKYYENNGFFDAAIDTSLIVDREDSTMNILLTIREGRRSMIDTVLYKGLDVLSEDVRNDIVSNSLLHAGDPFVLGNLETEVRRDISKLANNGYVNMKVDTIDAHRYASTNNFSIILSYIPGAQYMFGRIHIQEDTASQAHIDSMTVLRHLDYREGDFYSEQRKNQSERNLNRLGIFDVSKIENVVPASLNNSLSISTNVLVRTRSFQELAPELGVNDENNAFNVSVGMSYNHRNFFGRARNFSLSLNANIQNIFDVQFKRLLTQTGWQDSSLVSKVDLSAQIIQPFFFNNQTSLSATLSAIFDKQKTYYLPVVQGKLEVITQTATFTKAYIDWLLEFSNPKAVDAQHDTTIGTYAKQLNSIFTITLQRDKRNDIFYPTEGSLHSISLEESGTLPRAFGSDLNVNIPYSQYVKATVLAQWYWDPNGKRDIIFAMKWSAGAAFLYGHSPIDVPLMHRFFSGGSGSVRGWRARSLGFVDSTDDQGGDAFLDGSLEGRWNIFKNKGSFGFLDLEKISLVLFYDVGNVWSRPGSVRLTQIAMATGFGIRYNTVAGPIRIDFGMRVFDPDAYAAGGNAWITQKKFFSETFSSGVIHLGVGHSF